MVLQKEWWASTVCSDLTSSYRPIIRLCGPHSQLEVLGPAPACHHELHVRKLVHVHPPAQPLTENPAKGTYCIPGHALYILDPCNCLLLILATSLSYISLAESSSSMGFSATMLFRQLPCDYTLMTMLPQQCFDWTTVFG